MVVGLILLVASDALAKLLVSRYAVSQVVGVRASIVVGAIVLTALVRGELRRLRPNHVGSHLVRGGFAVLSTYLFVVGLSMVSLVNASAATYTGPIFLTALAPLLLGERVGMIRWCAVLVGFVGAIIMLRPTSSGLDWPMLLPAAAALCGALRDLVTRRISVTENSLAILLTSNLLLACVGVVVAIASWSPFRPADMLIIIGAGVLIAIAHYLHIESFRFAEAATVAPYRYTSIIWSALLSIVIWGDQPEVHIVIGGLIVITSGLVLFYRERTRS